MDGRPAASDAVARANTATGGRQSQSAVSAGPQDPARARYEQLLAAWIERHKYYPQLARRRGVEGTTLLSITLRRDGTVESTAVRQTSKHPLLDEASLEIVRAADPFPPVPPELASRGFAFSVPIRFTLE
jgi:TonB family protein